MNTAAEKIKIELPWKDKIAYLLLFLFPVAGMSVRHWISIIFTLLVLLSFSYCSKKAARLLKEEKTLLWILGIFFAVFVITALANGWTERQTKYLGVEIRYLLAIPLYLMVRQLPDAGTWILRGCIVGGIILGWQAFYDIEILNQNRATGIYSPNILGPLAVLFIFWAVMAFGNEKKFQLFRYLIPISALCSMYALLMSGSRGAYLGYIVVFFILWATLMKGWKKPLLLGIYVVILILVPYTFESTPDELNPNRIDNTIDEISEMVNIEGRVQEKKYIEGIEDEGLGGIEARVEMWKASWHIIKNNPLLGIGRGNYEVLMPEYIEKGHAPRALLMHGMGHPHNAYIEMLVSKGVVGLMVFIIMLLYPLILCASKYNLSSKTSAFILVHIAGFSIFSITDASTFIKGNYASIFLLFLVVFFSSQLHRYRDIKNNSAL